MLAEHGLTLTASPKKRAITRRGGRCPVVVPMPVVELSSWPEWPERPPTMVLSRRDEADPHAVPLGRGEAQGPLPLSTRSHVELLGRVLYHGPL
jgi:hypothetical protein